MSFFPLLQREDWQNNTSSVWTTLLVESEHNATRGYKGLIAPRASIQTCPLQQRQGRFDKCGILLTNRDTDKHYDSISCPKKLRIYFKGQVKKWKDNKIQNMSQVKSTCLAGVIWCSLYEQNSAEGSSVYSPKSWCIYQYDRCKSTAALLPLGALVVYNLRPGPKETELCVWYGGRKLVYVIYLG